jgi:hypothetical protein
MHFMYKLLLAILFTANISVCLAQDQVLFPNIDSTDLAGLKILGSRTFRGPALFGYMDGGAELFLEYGFSGALINEVSLDGQKYKIEIFRMDGPEEAFGIFSVSKFSCKSFPTVARFTCQTRFQLQVCKGDYFISIINRGGSVIDSINMLRIGKAVSGKIAGHEIDLSAYLPETSLTDLQKDCFLARGKLGVVNGAPDLENFFKDSKDFSAVILNKQDQVIISVRFKSSESMADFLKLHGWDIRMISGENRKMKGAESVKLFNNNHLYIIVSK